MREKLIELLNKVQNYGTKNTYEEYSITVESKNNEIVADHLIANGVTIPVRCKDCKYCETFYPEKEIGKEARQVWYCKLYKFSRKPEEFCSDGERK